MSYEAGSKECRHLIEAKESLLSTLDALSNINSTVLIQIQIKEIYYPNILKILPYCLILLLNQRLLL